MATTASARLALYQAAEEEILSSGQSLAIAGRQLTRADLKWIGEMIKRLEAQSRTASAGPIRGALGRTS